MSVSAELSLDEQIREADAFARRLAESYPSVSAFPVVVLQPRVRRARVRRTVQRWVTFGGSLLLGAEVFAIGAHEHSLPLFIGGLVLVMAGFTGFAVWIARSGS